jgi:hypothetical protein
MFQALVAATPVTVNPPPAPTGPVIQAASYSVLMTGAGPAGVVTLSGSGLALGDVIGFTCAVDSVSILEPASFWSSQQVQLRISPLTQTQSCTATVAAPGASPLSFPVTVTAAPYLNIGGALYYPPSNGGPAYVVVYGLGFAVNGPAGEELYLYCSSGGYTISSFTFTGTTQLNAALDAIPDPETCSVQAQVPADLSVFGGNDFSNSVMLTVQPNQ